MSGGLAPSKSTVYVSNLPFSLTNNDLYRIFSKYGKVVKVTIMKDKDTRKSKGVAFILFLDKDSAQNCTRAINNKQLFGRVIKASIAIDNGRAAEFIRRRNYFDKSKCYECGESGHLSYACPKNMLGEREPPKKKEKKKKKKIPEPEEEIEEVEESEDEGEDPALDSLSQAIAFQVKLPRRPWKSTEGKYKGMLVVTAAVFSKVVILPLLHRSGQFCTIWYQTCRFLMLSNFLDKSTKLSMRKTWKQLLLLGSR
ncbi:zinc finger CCHC-type and RNA-binding motif-containing protein 1 isoform X1 [Sciurus carolinensis]|nr:zinc finger CCHC-type and RNA-binding motif-containing protein 1 isoform X1 [Sciurus carolinensis]